MRNNIGKIGRGSSQEALSSTELPRSAFATAKILGTPGRLSGNLPKGRHHTTVNKPAQEVRRGSKGVDTE